MYRHMPADFAVQNFKFSVTKLIVTCNEDSLHEHDVHIRRSYSCNECSLHVTKICYMNTMSLLSVAKLALMRYEICELLVQIKCYIGSCVT